MRQGTFYVYIITNTKRKPLYIGVTNNLEKRISEHISGINSSFSKKYNLKKLVYFENYSRIEEAIKREKQLKNWHREWKLNLIRSENPHFKDLFKKHTESYQAWREFE